MSWYEKIEPNIEYGRTYSYKNIKNELIKASPGLHDSSYRSAINNLLHEGRLYHVGYDAYSFSNNDVKPQYSPLYSDEALALSKMINEKYPLVTFTVFETVLMNEFLNHLIAQNTIFLQVEKDSSIFIFRFLQDAGFSNTMYKPSEKDFDLYWTRNCIVITDMISEAPLRSNPQYEITLEKMLVDMVTDKLISNTFSKSELPAVFEQAQQRYSMDRIRALRYARRRNRKDEIKNYLEGAKNE